MCDCQCRDCYEGEEGPGSESWVPLDQRAMAPLPKRMRVLAPPVPAVHQQSAAAESDAGGRAAQHELEPESDGEESRAREDRAESRAREFADARRAGDGEVDYGGLDARAYEHWLAKRGELPDSSLDFDRGADGSTTKTHSLDPSSTASDSPPTSPASEQAPSLGDEAKEAALGSGALFGDEGRRIANSLAKASSFSPAGLFGGLGLATLHPSLAQPSHDRCEEDEDCDEDNYGCIDRSRPPVEPSLSSQAGATALGLGGSNKKKRKIPGLNTAGAGVEDSGAEDGGKETVKSPSVQGEFATNFGPMKAPVNPPTTAKAALAKLRDRPPHISLCIACFSARRQRRKRLRSTEVKHHPLPLPAAPSFVAPAMPRDGPPPLPPGSGLKGSKALKAAMKAHREREKEKERIRKLFALVKVPDLYDPDGMANPAPVVVSRAIKADLARRKAEGRSLPPSKQDASSAYPTPPGSSDEGENEADPSSAMHWTAGLPELDLFKFVEHPSPILEGRWTALNDQKERLKAAKERAAKAREEEKERRREKEEKERAEAAAAAAETAPPAAATPPTSAATAKRTATRSAAPPPSQPPPATPASAPAPVPLRPSASAPAPAPTPAAAAAAAPTPPPPPPPIAKPKKKGRKKRSAHANAHNMHHRDNYIPSRLPSQTNTSQGPHGQHGDGSSTPLLTSWPASDEAIAAAGPYASTCGGGHFFDPTEEILCLFCDYELFYGEESLLLKAVKKRNKRLEVRKKARDRATKATQGAAPAAPAPSPAPVEGAAPPMEEGVGGEEVVA
ncbi:hypothetical protein JCM6882_009494 [Rhodosporidiobolus microsporus]